MPAPSRRLRARRNHDDCAAVRIFRKDSGRAPRESVESDRAPSSGLSGRFIADKEKRPAGRGRGALVSANAREGYAFRCTLLSVHWLVEILHQRREHRSAAVARLAVSATIPAAVAVRGRSTVSTKSAEQSAVTAAISAVVVVRRRSTVSTLAAQPEQSTSDRRAVSATAVQRPLILTDQGSSRGRMAVSTIALIGPHDALRSVASASTTAITAAIVRRCYGIYRGYISRRTIVSAVAVAVIPVGVSIFPIVMFAPVISSGSSRRRHPGGAVAELMAALACHIRIIVIMVLGSRGDRRRQHRETNQHRHQTSFGI